MNIWLFNHYAITPDQAGGTRHFNLARELVARGHRVTIIASAYDHFQQTEAHLEPHQTYKAEWVEGVKFIWLRTPPYKGNSVARVWNMLVFSWKVNFRQGFGDEPRPDVILGSSPHIFTAYAAKRLARRFAIPFVLEVRDLWPDSLIDLGRISAGHPAMRMMRWLERDLYRSATGIVSLLPLAKDHIMGFGVPEKKVHWIPNGVDVEHVPVPMKIRSEFIVMYAGAHGLANNLDLLVEAARILAQKPSLSHVRIELVGAGPEKTRLQNKVREAGLSNIVFRDPVPKDQVSNLLESADALVLILQASPVFRWGISPNKLYDYLAAARPVIFAVETPFNPVDQVQAGISVSKLSPLALAEAIEALSRTPTDELQAQGNRGRELVLRHHRYSHLAGQLEEVLTEAIGTKAIKVKHDPSPA